MPSVIRLSIIVLVSLLVSACGAEDPAVDSLDPPGTEPLSASPAGERSTVVAAASPCPPVTATNAEHVASGRAQVRTTTFLFFTLNAYSATGTGEALGADGAARVTLYPIGPGRWSTSNAACPTTAPSRPPCIGTPSEVALMGDSFINWPSHTFPADLNREAGQTFRMYAVGGFSMGSGGIGTIGPQLDQALAAGPVKTIVLDGGGNDILIPDVFQFPGAGNCKNDANAANVPDCQRVVQKALDSATTLMLRAADAGVRDVVYFFYPRVPEGTLIGGAKPNAMLDYALPRVRSLCDQAVAVTGGRLTCHFVDMIPVFAGHPEYFALGDIHPNVLGSAAMAKTVWGKMKEVCVAQPQSSGCCSYAGEPPAEERGCGATRILPLPADPGVTGPWPVGVRTVRIGRLDVEVAYPARPGSEAGLAEATYDVRDWLPASQRSKVPDASSPAVTPIDGSLYRDLPLDPDHGPYPVVVFIHGTASFRIASGSTMAHWASRGFVVLAADYPGLFLGDQLCSTLECSCPTTGAQDIPGDVNAQIAALRAGTGGLAFLAGKVDLARMAISGHSQGGCVTATLGGTPGVKLLMPFSASTNVTSPAPAGLESILYVSGMSDTVIGYDAPLIGNLVCPPNPGPATSTVAAFQASPGPPGVTKRLIGIAGGGHLLPTDLCQTNALGRNAIQEAQADGVCGINSAVIIGLPTLFDCGTLPMPTGVRAVSYATSAALEETLLCQDRRAAFQNLRVAVPAVGAFEEARN